MRARAVSLLMFVSTNRLQLDFLYKSYYFILHQRTAEETRVPPSPEHLNFGCQFNQLAKQDDWFDQRKHVIIRTPVQHHRTRLQHQG